MEVWSTRDAMQVLRHGGVWRFGRLETRPSSLWNRFDMREHSVSSINDFLNLRHSIGCFKRDPENNVSLGTFLLSYVERALQTFRFGNTSFRSIDSEFPINLFYNLPRLKNFKGS